MLPPLRRVPQVVRPIWAGVLLVADPADGSAAAAAAALVRVNPIFQLSSLAPERVRSVAPLILVESTRASRRISAAPARPPPAWYASVHCVVLEVHLRAPPD